MENSAEIFFNQISGFHDLLISTLCHDPSAGPILEAVEALKSHRGLLVKVAISRATVHLQKLTKEETQNTAPFYAV